jgi:hypothetical protein
MGGCSNRNLDAPGHGGHMVQRGEGRFGGDYILLFVATAARKRDRARFDWAYIRLRRAHAARPWLTRSRVICGPILCDG